MKYLVWFVHKFAFKNCFTFVDTRKSFFMTKIRVVEVVVWGCIQRGVYITLGTMSMYAGVLHMSSVEVVFFL